MKKVKRETRNTVSIYPSPFPFHSFIDPSPLTLHPSHIKLIVFDFDGVMTDNRVLVSEDGKESVFCNRFLLFLFDK